MTDALFVTEGDDLVPTELTRGGWTDDSQHGGPPSGLLARSIELVPTAVPMQVVRFTVDLFRPVPLKPLRVETQTRRDGKRIQVVDAFLKADDIELGRASALKIRVGAIDLPETEAATWVNPVSPEDINVLDWSHYGDKSRPRFHYDAIEIRSVDDSFISRRPGLSWFRLRYPLVLGEELTPFTRLATVADMANGNSQALDPARWVFINPDINVYCHRLPEGEWIGMHSAAFQHATGIGMTDSWVFDQTGAVGRINQAQLIEPRGSAD